MSEKFSLGKKNPNKQTNRTLATKTEMNKGTGKKA